MRTLQPVLDLQAWRDGSDRDGVARRFDRICREIGFFYLSGHGVDPSLLDRQLRATEDFFSLPEAVKRGLHVDRRRRGYEPFGLQSLDANAPADVKESLLLGIGQPDDHPLVLEGLANYGANRWPDEMRLPGFRAQCEAYFEAMLALGHTLLEVFARVAGLPEHHFDALLVDPMITLRLIHYPPQPVEESPGQLGCGTHTDWGALTLLLQDPVGGLEVMDAAGDWVSADPRPGTLLVNVGDLMPIWTHGAYHSNPHRVRNRHPERHRYSVPFFIDPNYHAQIACLPAFLPAGDVAVPPPLTVGQHIDRMYARSYGQSSVAQVP